MRNRSTPRIQVRPPPAAAAPTRAKTTWRWVLTAVAAAVACAAILVPAGPADAIIGGRTASFSEYPYFARVQTPTTPDSFCGGSVIAPTWILTAAHCLAGAAPGQVRVGLSNGQWTIATFLVTNPQFNGDVKDGHDLALVEVPAASTVGITPVQVGSPWNESVFQPGTPVTLMGTGITAGGAHDNNVFRSVETTVRSDADMDDVFNRWWTFDYWIEHLMIGAGGSLRTFCQGDSGSPMVASLSGRPVVIGVDSFTWPNCTEAAADMEMSGPQLAWIGIWALTVRLAWGPCAVPGSTTPGIGTTAYFHDTAAAPHVDGDYSWDIKCIPDRPPPAPAPTPTPRPNPGPICPGGDAIKCN